MSFPKKTIKICGRKWDVAAGAGAAAENNSHCLNPKTHKNQESDKQQRHYLGGCVVVVDVVFGRIYTYKYNKQTFSFEDFRHCVCVMVA